MDCFLTMYSSTLRRISEIISTKNWKNEIIEESSDFATMEALHVDDTRVE